MRQKYPLHFAICELFAKATLSGEHFRNAGVARELYSNIQRLSSSGLLLIGEVNRNPVPAIRIRRSFEPLSPRLWQLCGHQRRQKVSRRAQIKRPTQSFSLTHVPDN